MTAGSPGRSEAGETLIEILIAVAIMGIVMVGMVASLTTATIASDNHRRLSDVEIVARAYGEAVVNQAQHPLATTLTAAAATGDTVLLVTSSTGFTTTSFASVDGEVVDVKAVATGKLTINSGLTADHPSGSPVTLYEPCPSAAALTVSGFTHSADRVGTPTITKVEYFAQPSAAGVAPLPVTAAACTNFWNTTGLPCMLDETPPHYTACDPPLIRVTIAVDGTEGVNNARRATTTTRVYVNRANA